MRSSTKHVFPLECEPRPNFFLQEITQLHQLATILRARNEERYANEILALMLPRSIAEKLKKAGDPDARFAAAFPETSVLFGEPGCPSVHAVFGIKRLRRQLKS